MIKNYERSEVLEEFGYCLRDWFPLGASYDMNLLSQLKQSNSGIYTIIKL